MKLIFCLMMNAALASPGLQLKVESPELKYKVSMQDGKFLYESTDKKVEQRIQACSARAFSNFADKVETEIKNDHAKTTVKVPKSIEVTLNNEKFYLPPLSKSGVYVSKVDTEVDYLISEAIYRCSKK